MIGRQIVLICSIGPKAIANGPDHDQVVVTDHLKYTIVLVAVILSSTQLPYITYDRLLDHHLMLVVTPPEPVRTQASPEFGRWQIWLAKNRKKVGVKDVQSHLQHIRIIRNTRHRVKFYHL